MKPAPASRTIAPGDRLGTRSGQSVTVRSWRGEGSYARVYRGDYGESALPCAVKAPRPEAPEAAGRLRAERELLAGLRHPAIVTLLDWERPGEPLFLVLEWLEGETLHDAVTRLRRLPLRRALDILAAAADGLAHFHARRRSHGDVRPQNVLLVPGRGAVLTDPGLPREAPAPAGAGNGAAEDVRAAGALLHFMLTGEPPGSTPCRLTTASGYNNTAVRLWETTRSPAPPSAAWLRDQVRALRGAL